MIFTDFKIYPKGVIKNVDNVTNSIDNKRYENDPKTADSYLMGPGH